MEYAAGIDELFQSRDRKGAVFGGKTQTARFNHSDGVSLLNRF